MIPERGFPQIEFEQRLEKAQRLMSEKDLDVMFFCTEAEVRYFTGFLTQFWQSPTRPWFLCLPRKGNPVAVIPEIGADCMGRAGLKILEPGVLRIPMMMESACFKKLSLSCL